MEEGQGTRMNCNECLEHGVVTLKLGQLCGWKEAHEQDTKEWREKVNDKFGSLNKWAIANLTALCLTLIGIIALLVK